MNGTRVRSHGDAPFRRHPWKIPMTFNLPDDAEYFISLQRTQYQTWLIRKARRYLPSHFVEGALLRFVEKMRKQTIASLYFKDMQDEFETIEPYIDRGAKHVLDIGCGMAGIDVFISRHVSAETTIHLMDRTQIDPIYYGFKISGAFYNNFDITREFLTSNGMNRDRLHFITAAKGKIAESGYSFDLILSLLSWGFHYPLDYYLDEALDALTPTGLIIIDLRSGSGDLEFLQNRPGCRPQIIADRGKYMRVAIART